MSAARFFFLRFGPLPADGQSRNHRDDILEDGVSVYEAVERDGRIQVLVPSWGDVSVLVSMSGAIQGNHGKPYPAFEVEGQVVGTGSDGEPLLRPCGIVRLLQPDAFVGVCG